MDFSIKLHPIKSGWSIVYIEESHFVICKNTVLPSLKIKHLLENSVDPAAFHLVVHYLPKYPIRGSGLQTLNSVDPGEIPLYAVFHFGVHSMLLPKYPFMGFRSTKG